MLKPTRRFIHAQRVFASEKAPTQGVSLEKDLQGLVMMVLQETDWEPLVMAVELGKGWQPQGTVTHQVGCGLLAELRLQLQPTPLLSLVLLVLLAAGLKL
jgi:hypothetical protein